MASVLIWATRRFALGHGRPFALYVAAYTFGRFWIEGLRIDTVKQVGGLRLNEWTSVILFLAALVYLVGARRVTPEHISIEPADVDDEPQQTTAQRQRSHTRPDSTTIAYSNWTVGPIAGVRLWQPRQRQ